MNVIHKYEGQYDPDMNRELYLLTEVEIQKTEYDRIKEYGVTGPDFQIVTRGSKYFLKGDMDVESLKKVVNELVGEEVFTVTTDEE